MNHSVVLLLVTSLSLIASGRAIAQPTPDLAADEAALRAVNAAALEAAVNEDLEAWLATVAEDAVLLTNDGAVRGKEALRERFARTFAAFDWEGSWSLEEIDISGDLAVVWGPIETILTARDGSTRIHLIGTHIGAARRQPEGSWKFTWWTSQVRQVDSDEK